MADEGVISLLIKFKLTKILTNLYFKKLMYKKILMIKKIYILILILIISCSRNSILEDQQDQNTDVELNYPVSMMDAYSLINKTTSWYRTNQSFSELYNVHRSKYWGFEYVNGSFYPFIPGTFSENKIENYYWNDLGGYLFTDLTGDGKRDLWAYYLKAPWPTNKKGLHLFVDNYKNDVIDLQYGLTQVRKQVLSDFNNDAVSEIMLFSSGYDAGPFPGDSLAYFTVSSKSYTYLAEEIGYFHGGATGDVDQDGYEDIVAYSGGSAVIPVHPVHYKNNRGTGFILDNSIFKNFSDEDNFYTVELYDIDNDGWLDLFLGSKGKLVIIKSNRGVFDREQGINIQTDSSLEVMDIDFFDFDKDGKDEILVMNNRSFYKGYSLKLYDYKTNSADDITSLYFDDTEYDGPNSWIKWIHIFDFDKDGDLDIVADGLFGELYGTRGEIQIYWKNSGNRMIKTSLTN